MRSQAPIALKDWAYVPYITFKAQDGKEYASVHAPLEPLAKRDLLEILDDRYQKKSTLVAAQLPLENWHAWIADPALADAILDRLVHNAVIRMLASATTALSTIRASQNDIRYRSLAMIAERTSLGDG